MIKAQPGESIYHAAQRAISYCQNFGVRDTLKFNGIDIHVCRYSFDEDIATIYNLKMQIKRMENN